MLLVRILASVSVAAVAVAREQIWPPPCSAEGMRSTAMKHNEALVTGGAAISKLALGPDVFYFLDLPGYRGRFPLGAKGSDDVIRLLRTHSPNQTDVEGIMFSQEMLDDHGCRAESVIQTSADVVVVEGTFEFDDQCRIVDAEVALAV